MLNVYTHKKIDGISHIPILDYYYGPSNFSVKRYGDSAIALMNKQFFNLVQNPEEADYFLLPHNFFYIKNQDYLNDFVELSKKHNKKIIVFSYGDSDDDIDVPNSIIFRSSQYRYKIKKNEVIMPAIADDLSIGIETKFRNKSEKAIVGFCGWAGYENFTRMVIENVKLTVLFLKRLFLSSNYFYQKRGLMFRMEAIKHLKNSNLVLTNFIIRNSFSGNEKTRKIDIETARKEYVKNILNSDLSLAVKGDGNFSIRFYEILSLGRVPLFVDTNCVLPLEDKINYDEFILKIDCKNLGEISKLSSDFYKNISNDVFIDMQKKARLAFDNYLRADKFFEYVFLKSDFLSKNI